MRAHLAEAVVARVGGDVGDGHAPGTQLQRVEDLPQQRRQVARRCVAVARPAAAAAAAAWAEERVPAVDRAAAEDDGDPLQAQLLRARRRAVGARLPEGPASDRCRVPAPCPTCISRTNSPPPWLVA
jgi:hypothetical protein